MRDTRVRSRRMGVASGERDVGVMVAMVSNSGIRCVFVARIVRTEQAKKDERKQMGYKDHQVRSTTQCDKGVNYNCTGLRSHLTGTYVHGGERRHSL